MINAARQFFAALIRKVKKQGRLDAARSAANQLNLDEFDTVWQNHVKAAMEAHRYRYVGGGRPDAGNASSYGCRWFIEKKKR